MFHSSDRYQTPSGVLHLQQMQGSTQNYIEVATNHKDREMEHKT
jgi:hypothetical protein